MLLISQNVGSYELKIPKGAIFRINLAWCNTLNELKAILKLDKSNEWAISYLVKVYRNIQDWALDPH